MGYNVTFYKLSLESANRTAFSRRYDAKTAVLIDQRFGKTNVHITSESFLPIQIGLGLQKRSPIGPMFNYKMQQMREAGLLDKWILDGIAGAGRLAEKSERETRIPLGLTIDDLQSIFLLFLVMTFACLVVVLAEFVTFYVS